MRHLIAFVFIFTVVASVANAGQNSIAVVFAKDSSRNTHIGAFERQGTLYGSLTDLISVFLLKSGVDPAVRKLEFQSGKYSVQVTGNNPFVTMTDRDSNVSVLQLPYRVLYAAKSYFVPVQAFLPVLTTVMPGELSFDAASASLTIGHTVERSAFDITGADIDEKENGIAIRLFSQTPLKNYESWLKPMVDHTYLYVTIDGARADTNAIHLVKTTNSVREILVFSYPASVQFVFEIVGKVSSVEAVPVSGSNDVIFAVHTPLPEPAAPAPKTPSSTKQTDLDEKLSRDLTETLDHQRSRWKLDCIVIDAGHGGQDPGTIGVTRVKEKDVTLAIALKLGRLIAKHLPDVKVVYTRKNDTFIELDKRGQIANAAAGKLFISIHCNAAPRKPSAPNGFEIYLLRPGKTENAIRIAERENSSVKFEKDYEKRYQALTEEHFILLTMAQSAYVKYSEKFAGIVSHEMRNNIDLQDNGVKQAGFLVLVGASMPNVLVETGYLSNRKDEKILKSAKGQDQIAESIFSGVKRYKMEYEKALTEGKEMELGE